MANVLIDNVNAFNVEEIDTGEVKKREEDSINNGRISYNPKQLEKWSGIYGIVGNHSAVHICKYTKDSLHGKGGCYKNKFYGIDTHKCAEMSPAAAWCHEACVFCWRPMEWYSRIKMPENMVDNPEEIINETVRVRKRLLSGFGGDKNVQKELFRNVYDSFPSHWAISLSGEPTIYPKIGQLIKILKNTEGVKSVFLVSNGQEPDVLLKMKEDNALPTQIYISIDASNEALFKKINRSLYKDGWQRLMTTIKEVLPKLPTRRVLRYTLIKGMNDMEYLDKEYAEIYEKSKADYIEIKAYMFLGQSRQRLNIENMPTFEYVKSYAERLVKIMPNYKIINEEKRARIVLLKRNDSPFNDRIKNPDALKSLKENATLPKEWE
ncbi:MAG: 4-demethylwyosine synthase TYW1 [Candidatus Anstonellales archaeon]